jgi:hypothetical protein
MKIYCEPFFFNSVIKVCLCGQFGDIFNAMNIFDDFACWHISQWSVGMESWNEILE